MQESLHREIERRAELEKTLADHEKEWTERCVQLEKERDDWEQAVAEEQKKNKDLQAVIARKELDIQRILQQKVRYVCSYCFSPYLSLWSNNTCWL
jgi:hypothetical protein